MNETALTILIADDEDGIRDSLAGILEMEGYRVVTARDGLDAVEKIKGHACNVAFLDIRMPGMSGIAVFREIQKFSPRTVVVLTTAYAIDDHIRSALKDGAYACIEKPYEMETIIGLIDDIKRRGLASEAGRQ